jgi:hypothetical protein
MEERDMKALGGDVQSFALAQGISILFIDHHRKGATHAFADPIDDILGSTAKAAVADEAMGLYRDQGKHTATLKVTGRDVEEQEFSLQWNGALGCWDLIGEGGSALNGTNKGKVLEAVRVLCSEGKSAYTRSIAQYLNMDEGNVSRALAELVTDNLIVKTEKVGKIQPYSPVNHEG